MKYTITANPDLSSPADGHGYPSKVNVVIDIAEMNMDEFDTLANALHYAKWCGEEKKQVAYNKEEYLARLEKWIEITEELGKKAYPVQTVEPNLIPTI